MSHANNEYLFNKFLYTTFSEVVIEEEMRNEIRKTGDWTAVRRAILTYLLYNDECDIKFDSKDFGGI